MRKTPIFEILEKMAALFRDNILDHMRQDNSKFEVLYWTQKTHANIALSFRELQESIKVLKSLKNICEDLMKYKYKMYVYNQLGYIHRLM